MKKLNTNSAYMQVKKSTRGSRVVYTYIASITEKELEDINRVIENIKSGEGTLNSSVFIKSFNRDVVINDVMLFGKADDINDTYTKRVLSELYIDDRWIPSMVDLKTCSISNKITETSNYIRIYNYHRCYIGNPMYIIIFKI